MSSLDLINLITYICAILGGILLFLCIVLACFFIYFQVRRLRNGGCTGEEGGRQYVIVPSGEHPRILENGHATQARKETPSAVGVFTLNSSAGGGGHNGHRDSNDKIALQSAEGQYASPKSTRNAPIKNKLLWRHKKKRSVGDVPGGKGGSAAAGWANGGQEKSFSPEDLDVPRVEPLFKKQKRKMKTEEITLEKYRRRSKSEWDLQDLPLSSSLLGDQESPRRQRANTLTAAGEVDIGMSQYFDAMETIDEFEEEEETHENNSDCHSLPPDQRPLLRPQRSFKLSSDEDQWEDIVGLEEIPEETSLQLRKFIKQSKALRNRKQALEDPMIKRRVKALKNLQMQAKQVEGKFFEDLNNIENRYRVNRLNPIYDSRMRIVQGDLEDSQGVPENCGVPLFWLHAMLNCDTLKPIIQEHDLPILKYLSDIRVVSSHKSSIKNSNSAKSSSSHSFSLEFHFMPNEFFQDRVLVKDYEVSCCPDPEDLIAFGGPEIVNCKGCKINWNKGRNATLRPVKKLAKSTGQVVQKWAKRNSFFNFFNPPRLTGREALTDIKKTMLLEAHFEIGLHFKETFVPKAIIFFLSEEAIGQSNVSGVRRGSLDATAVVAGKKKVTAAGAGSIHGGKLGNKKKSGGVAGNGGRNVTAAMIGGDSSADQSTPSVFSNSNLSVNNIISSRTTSIVDDSNEEEGTSLLHTTNPASASSGAENSAQKLAADEAEKIAADPILGRYRMASSQGFDEFMKALGVGLMKRKMANSVTPVNVVEIEEDGTYVIRTETTLRTTEIRFRLNETFSEPTLDGRVTQTMPTRDGNILTLVQKGDPSKKEKDTKMIRDFQGDTMYMELIVDNAVCKRVYQRIVDE